jgi:hypothetical protein
MIKTKDIQKKKKKQLKKNTQTPQHKQNTQTNTQHESEYTKFPLVILQRARSNPAHLSLGMTPVTKLTKEGNKAIEAKKLMKGK